jgi:hypothetical protein
MRSKQPKRDLFCLFLKRETKKDNETQPLLKIKRQKIPEARGDGGKKREEGREKGGREIYCFVAHTSPIFFVSPGARPNPNPVPPSRIP